MSDEQYDAALSLLRRLDPKNVSANLNSLCKIAPELAEDLLSSVDQPLGVKTCKQSKKEYLTCDYNRDGDSFRSPWSNEYEPATDGPQPSAELRKLEVLANDSFDIYRDLYYEGGVSSVYLWDQDDSFAGVVLLKKTSPGSSWDSIHVFEVETSRGEGVYRVTSTVILDLGKTALSLSGNLTRQTEREMAVDEPSQHIANLGSIVEDVESKLRNQLQEVYFGKARDIVGQVRSIEAEDAAKKLRQEEVIKGLQ
ncbi:F-actin-capping protein subunit beta [Yarrowia sp. B02]|nr:F-actin-capping protein subunit beta [Yarrowia sp. B02]